MKLVKLTSRDNTAVYVNVNLVQTIVHCVGPAGGKTMIDFGQGDVWYVLETPDEIVVKVQ